MWLSNPSPDTAAVSVSFFRRPALRRSSRLPLHWTLPAAASSQSAMILVAEDEALVRAVTARVLDRAGYTVLEAEDGEQALEVLRRYHSTLDLVISDVVMAKLDGRELVRRVMKVAWPAHPAHIGLQPGGTNDAGRAGGRRRVPDEALHTERVAPQGVSPRSPLGWRALGANSTILCMT